MRYTVGAAIWVVALWLLPWNRLALAQDAGDAATVRVSFAEGETELDTMKEGAKCFTNRQYEIENIPPELLGTTFTRRAGGSASDVAIDASSGATVYLLCDGDKGAHLNEGAVELNQRLAASGWSRLADCDFGRKKNPLAVYKQVFASPQHLALQGATWSGFILAAPSLALSSSDGGNKKEPEKKDPENPSETSTVHNDPAPASTLMPGPTTRVSNPQSSIESLEVYTAESGMMLGRTSEVVLTVTRGDKAKMTAVRFVTPVGDQMCMARDEALRFIHVAYPNWYADTAELTFEDKYTAHDGGSIGAAVGTLILSAIQDFSIDPDAAITGDISANGKVRAIGGIAAKIRGATASKCTVVAVPMENFDQLVDSMVYNGPAIVANIQVIGISNLADAVAVMREDRDAKLVKAIDLFQGVQQSIKASSGYIHSKEAQDKLAQVLLLAPNHLSAKLLLMVGQDEQPKTLSATASMYYTFVAVRGMLPILAERSNLGTMQVPSVVVRDGLADLKKLRPMADESVRPLIDAWSRYLWGWTMFQNGNSTKETFLTQAQAVDDAMAELQADPALMQKMLKEGI